MRIAGTLHTCLVLPHGKAEAEAPAVISESRAFLQKTRLGERVRRALANHEMVEYPHVDKRQGRLQLLGQYAIRIGWLRGARGALMGVLCPVFLCAIED